MRLSHHSDSDDIASAAMRNLLDVSLEGVSVGCSSVRIAIGVKWSFVTYSHGWDADFG